MIKPFELPTPDEVQIAVKSGDPTGLAIFLSLYAVADSKWRADFTTAINEILEADRDHRGDPRLAELQRLAGVYIASDKSRTNRSGLSRAAVVSAWNDLLAALSSLAASPTIEPGAGYADARAWAGTSLPRSKCED